MNKKQIDERWMRRALELAQKTNPSPNPKVGAVIVKNNKVIGEGYHQQAGSDHAEVLAIRSVKNKASIKGATLYVTLEPCSHYGKTPPCTEAIIQTGIKRVVFATPDPNKKAGGGENVLTRENIEITKNILKKEAEQSNPYFFYAHKYKRPYLIQKSAVTLDGKIWSKKQKNITGKESLQDVHYTRNSVDAILVGTNTVLKDNPHLTCRLPGGKDPLRVILDAKGKIPTTAKVFKDNNVLLISTKKASKKKLHVLQKKNIPYLIFSKTITPKKVLAALYGQGICSVLLEGGAKMNTSFAKYASEFQWYIAPIMFGEKNTTPLFATPISLNVAIEKVEQIGSDVKITAKPISLT